MAIQVEKVYKSSKEPYKMKLIAGADGLKNVISWVHILENVVVRGYVRGNEFIFTTGIVYQNNQWLLDFVKGLYAHHVSALAVNIGPYIKEVPKEVVDFCDEKNLPLFTIPWEIQLVDITKSYCSQIIEDRQNESDAANIIKNILFSSAEISGYQVELSGFGFTMGANYCFFIMVLEYDKDGGFANSLTIAKNNTKMIIDRLGIKYSLFIRNDQIITLLSETRDNMIKKLTEDMAECFFSEKYNFTFRIGVGKVVDSIYGITESYTCASHSLNLAKKTGKNVIFYEEMDIYKILLLVEQKEVLHSIYQETIGTLEKIDKKTNSDYVNILKLYVFYNGNIQKLADDLYVHRNTINYKLKQIKKLIGCDLNQMEDRFRIMLALKIGEIL